MTEHVVQRVEGEQMVLGPPISVETGGRLPAGSRGWAPELQVARIAPE